MSFEAYKIITKNSDIAGSIWFNFDYIGDFRSTEQKKVHFFSSFAEDLTEWRVYIPNYYEEREIEGTRS